MDEMTYDQALAHVALAEVLEWLQQVNATIRFYDDDDGALVRVAVRTNPDAPDDFTAALVPVADGSPMSLAISLLAAREEIEPLIRRRTLHSVP